MHPRIKYLYSLINEIKPEKVLDIAVLQLLKDEGSTRTEAAITLHLGFNIDAVAADKFVIESMIWPGENIEDVFYQTMKYLQYNPNDPDYDADDNRVKISI